MQGKSPLVQVKEPYGNLGMVTCKLSSSNPECTKHTCHYNAREGFRQYMEKESNLVNWHICFAE